MATDRIMNANLTLLGSKFGWVNFYSFETGHYTRSQHSKYTHTFPSGQWSARTKLRSLRVGPLPVELAF